MVSAHWNDSLAKEYRNFRYRFASKALTNRKVVVAGGTNECERYMESGAVGRFGKPEDVARAVRFFLEPDGCLTGQVLVVDGGLSIRRDR